MDFLLEADLASVTSLFSFPNISIYKDRMLLLIISDHPAHNSENMNISENKSCELLKNKMIRPTIINLPRMNKHHWKKVKTYYW